VPRYTRRQLKQDQFAVATKEAVHWTVEHRNALVTVLVIAGAIALLAFGGFLYLQNQNQKASAEYGAAMRLYTSPLRPKDAPATPEDVSYTTATDRAKAANKQFASIADRFGMTKTGKMSRYMAGVTAFEAGDNKAAEETLKKAEGQGKDVSALAKFALASLYRSTQREDDAIKMYRDVIDLDAETVPKATAELELAALYESQKNNGEAAKLYEDLKKNSTKDSGLQEVADAKLKALQGGSTTPANAPAPRK
jgi:tetratricopeptide (TPR) repeat protein